jgi:hypothetical protein
VDRHCAGGSHDPPVVSLWERTIIPKGELCQARRR